jgi:hypothetical protein
MQTLLRSDQFGILFFGSDHGLAGCLFNPLKQISWLFSRSVWLNFAGFWSFCLAGSNLFVAIRRELMAISVV